MTTWEFVVVGRIIVSAHCQADAADAAMDAAREVFVDIDEVTLVSGGHLTIV
jgi:hypothetical protein